MPVYNALPYLDEAIDSILKQSFADFRYMIYDDHSNDGSYACALAWAQKDSRITVVRGSERLGPCGSSNAAASLAQTDLVARMDADDVAMPGRLQAQLEALIDYPEAVMVGSTFDQIDASGQVWTPAKPGRARGDTPPIAHPSILYRRNAFEAAGGYRESTDYFEDRDLYHRMAAIGSIVVVNRPLLKIRYAGQHARLGDDPESILKSVNRLYASAKVRRSFKRPIAPMAFYTLCNLAMFGEMRPAIFKLMIHRMSFAEPLRALLVAAIVVLTVASPKAAKICWLAVTRIRHALAPTVDARKAVYVWNDGFGL